MLAMPGLRTFALAAKPGSEGVSCDARGVSVGGVPLLQGPGARNPFWSVRQLGDLNKDLSARYRLPIDIASKSSALALIAVALNRGDLAMAAIAAVQMQIPDPPLLAKRAENLDEITQRARDLNRSGLPKFWDPALHPRDGVPPNPGWFAPTGAEAETADVIPVAMGDGKPGPFEPIPYVEDGNAPRKPWEPLPAEGEEGENAPRGNLELPLPGGSPEASEPGAAPVNPSAPAPAPTPRGSWTLPDPKSKLPFMSETEPQLAPRKNKDDPTSGIFQAPNLPPIELDSGEYGPAAAMPKGSPGFDGVTRLHVEGHAAALMRQFDIPEAWLEITTRKCAIAAKRC
jgi:hypothetical protein